MQRCLDKNETETAYVMVNCENGTELKVMEDLGSIDGIKEVKYTFGSYDIVTKVEASSVESLREIISLKIRKIKNIHSTTTIICKNVLFLT